MTEQSSLVVRVFTSRAQIPVPGASVAVTYPASSGMHSLIALRQTDESGRIPLLTLPAPPRDDSQHPGDPRPFSVCDVWVEHPGFTMVHLEHMQLFAGITTVQDVALLPLPEQPENTDEAQVINITPQPL